MLWLPLHDEKSNHINYGQNCSLNHINVYGVLIYLKNDKNELPSTDMSLIMTNSKY